MKNLIVTAAGLSSRFEGLKPKWMLTHPKGNWMIVEALKDFDFESIDKVYLSFLQEPRIQALVHFPLIFSILTNT